MFQSVLQSHKTQKLDAFIADLLLVHPTINQGGNSYILLCGKFIQQMMKLKTELEVLISEPGKHLLGCLPHILSLVHKCALIRTIERTSKLEKSAFPRSRFSQDRDHLPQRN